MLGNSRRHLGLLVVAIGIPFLFAHSAEANDPDIAAVNCLSDVLLTAPNAVSVKPAKDWPFKIDDFWTVRKGVSYTFRNADGTEQAIGVYLATELDIQYPAMPPGGVAIGFRGRFVRADNGRYALVLQEPFPQEWYPYDKEVFTPPNETTYVQQKSKEHPLYELWDKLATQCRVDNEKRRGASVP